MNKALTKSRLTQAQELATKVGGDLSISLARNKLSRMQIHEAVDRLDRAKALLEDVLKESN